MKKAIFKPVKIGYEWRLTIADRILNIIQIVLLIALIYFIISIILS